MRKGVAGAVFSLLLMVSSLHGIFILTSQYWTGTEGEVKADTESLGLKHKPSAAEIRYDCVDAWVIVGGDRSDHEAWDLVLLTTEWVYDMVKYCGCVADNIYYLVAEYAADETTREDNTTSRNNIRYALETWAPTKVEADGVLGVYLHDHGGTNAMAIAPYSGYTAANLDSDLDAFQAASGCDRIIVIYEACSAGSFLDELSQSDRIIMTSSEPDTSAWWSPIEPHISMFGEGLFDSLLAGNTIGDAFVDATDQIDALGYADYQHPCIDDNHDGMGHIVNAWGELPSTGDGNDAENTYLCVSCGIPKLIPPYLYRIPLKKWYPYIEGSVLFTVSISVASEMEVGAVFCRVVPEDWTPPDPLDAEAMGRWDDNEAAFRWDLVHTSGDTYWARIEILNPQMDTDYNLCFFGEDMDGNRGPVVATQVAINEDGIPPNDIVAPTVVITHPIEGAVINDTVTISVETADDNSGVKEVQIFVDGKLKSTTELPDYLPYPTITYELSTTDYTNGDLNITAIAVDNANNTNSFSVNLEVDNPKDSWWFSLPVILREVIFFGGVGLLGISLIIGACRKEKRKK